MSYLSGALLSLAGSIASGYMKVDRWTLAKIDGVLASAACVGSPLDLAQL